MTPKDDAWSRLRAREDEEELEKEKAQDDASLRASRSGKKGATAEVTTGETGKIEELLGRVEPLIDQLNSLYQMFASGIEKRPPVERRKHLEQTMQTLSLMAKPSASLLFRFNAIHARYVAHRDRWDKTLRAMEAGKTGKATRRPAR
ncbi:MAG: hypothetical protein A2X94_14395 [Bdellovibrionales bacterium GWB1_55_8]|nr:MAG: hypothetical protein A2X94_14395 [Bdellovibrionales bacterium GWB1_55_8]